MAASLARKGKICCDIGTDHAYLPAKLVSENISIRALACDLRKGPLSNAAKTVEEYGISDKIQLRLSDGLDSVLPDEADDIFFCGMGGTLITELISRTEWLKNEKYRLIFQPQSHCEDIREYLVDNGFEIYGDRTCLDAGKLYCAFYAEYTGKNTAVSSAYLYVGNIPECKDAHSEEYTLAVIKRLKTKADALLLHGDKDESRRLYEAIDEIKEKLYGKG